MKKWSLRIFCSLEHLGVTYTVHLRLTEELIVNLLLVLIRLFSPGVTTEALREHINWKSAFLKGVGQFQ